MVSVWDEAEAELKPKFPNTGLKSLDAPPDIWDDAVSALTQESESQAFGQAKVESPSPESVMWQTQPSQDVWGQAEKEMQTGEMPQEPLKEPEFTSTPLLAPKGVSTIGLTHPEQQKAGEMLRQPQIDKQIEGVRQRRIADISKAMEANPDFYEGMTPEDVLSREAKAQKAGMMGDVEVPFVDPVFAATGGIGAGIPALVKYGIRTLPALISGTIAATTVDIPVGQMADELATSDFGRRYPYVPLAFNMLLGTAGTIGAQKLLDQGMYKTATAVKKNQIDKLKGDIADKLAPELGDMEAVNIAERGVNRVVDGAGGLDFVSVQDILKARNAVKGSDAAGKAKGLIPETPEPLNVTPEQAMDMAVRDMPQTLQTMFGARKVHYVNQGMGEVAAINQAFTDVSNTQLGQMILDRMNTDKVDSMRQAELSAIQEAQNLEQSEALRQAEEEAVYRQNPFSPVEEIAPPIMKHEGEAVETPITPTEGTKLTDAQTEAAKQQNDSNVNLEPQAAEGQPKAKEKAAVPKKSETSSLIEWINSKGGIDIGNLSGEFRIIMEDNPKAKFLKRKGGKWGVDQLAKMAYDEGLIKDTEPQTLMDALADKKWKSPETIEGEWATKDIINPFELAEGQKIIINGETYKRKGNVLEDGVDIPIDPFSEPIMVDKIFPPPKPKSKPVQKDMFGATKEGLEGPLVSKETPITPLEQVTEESKIRQAQTEEAKKQIPLPVTVSSQTGITEGQRVQLGKSPQTWVIEKVFPFNPKTDLEGEVYFSARNEKTGETGHFEKGDIRNTITTPHGDAGISVIKRIIKAKPVAEMQSGEEDISLQIENTERKSFYSKLHKVLSEQLPDTVTPTLFNRIISQNREGIRGIKSEEIADARATVNAIFGDKKFIPKQEILDYLKAADRTDVQDVVLGPIAAKPEDIQIKINRQSVTQSTAYVTYKGKDIYGGPIDVRDMTESQIRQRAIEWLWNQDERGTNSELDELPAFQRYTEPGAIPGSYREQFVTMPEMGLPKGWEITNEGKQGFLLRDEKGKPTGFYEDTQGKALSNRQVILPNEWQDGHPQYTDIKNPIVRIRFNDRLDVNNNTVRFIEEIQGPSPENEMKMPEIYKKYKYQIGLKRMLQGIAEENVERAARGEKPITRLAWTTGEQQAERYDLSKQVSEIHYDSYEIGKTGETAYDIKVKDKKGATVIEETQLSPQDLEKYIGKEATNKIIKGGEGTLSGLDLKVGGEGLKRLYNVTIPKFLERYGETWGAKVEEINIGLPNTEAATIWQSKQDGLWNVQDMNVSKTFKTETEARQFFNNLGTAKVQSIPITPEMQSSILHEGQPLFQVGRPSEQDISDTKDILKNLIDHLERMLGKVSLEFKPSSKMAADINTSAFANALRAHNLSLNDKFNIQGMHKWELEGNDIKHLITLADEIMNNPQKVKDVILHEGWHGVEAILKQTEEGKNLLKLVESKYGGKEERANAFRDYIKETYGGKKANIPLGIRLVFKRIAEFFKRLGNYLKGRGLSKDKVHELFDRAFSGKIRKGFEAERGIDKGTKREYKYNYEEGKEREAGYVSDTGVSDRDRASTHIRSLWEVVSQKTGNFKAGITKVTSAADVAHIVRDITRIPQEHLLAVVTNKNGRAIAVLRHTVGKTSNSQIEPHILAGQILNNMEAGNVWLVHNHPSGTIAPSSDDNSFHYVMKNLLDGTPVKLQDSVIVSGDRFGSTGQQGEIPKTEAKKNIPIMERRFAGNTSSGISLNFSESVREYGEKVLPDGGMIFVNAQLEPVGTLDIQQFELLRGLKQTAILKEAEKKNAIGMMVYQPNRNLSQDETNNLGRFAKASQISLIDVYDASGSAFVNGTLSNGDGIMFLQAEKAIRSLANLRHENFNELPNAEQEAVLKEAKRQLDAVKVLRDKQGRLITEAGELSKLNEHQYKQVRTEWFKDWFGDWQGALHKDVSKVIDPETGEPMVVYHGTTAGGIREFNAYNGIQGYHFGTENQASTILSRVTAELPGYMYKVFLNLKNPVLEHDQQHDWSRVVDIAKKQGYDGIEYENTYEGRGTSWVAFNPSQIKSAIGNIGTFSEKQPDISLQIDSTSGGGSAEFKPEEGFRRPSESTEAAAEPVRRSDIVKLLNEKLNVPIRTGRFRGSGRGVLGIFKLKEEVIRTKHANDIETISHEVGHGLQKFLWPESVNAKRGAAGMKAGPMEDYRSELDPLATKARAGQDQITEGFAEFIRLYVTNEAEARKVAPRFYDFFEKELDAKSPEAKQVLVEARRQFDRWIKQPSLARVLGQISVGEQDIPKNNLTNLYTATIDDLHPLKKAVEEMVGQKKDWWQIWKKGAEPSEITKDPYKLARLLRGWWGKADTFLEYKPFDFNTYEFKGKSLKEILAPIKDSLDEFRAYILSKRTLELNARGIDTGILPEDAKKVVSDYGLKFKQAFNDLKEYQDSTLSYLRDSGILDLQSYLKMKEANQDYIPFYRVMESAKGSGTGKGLEAWQPVKKIKGSWRDIVDPLESIIKNTYLYINLAEKNAVGRALVDLAASKEGLGKFVEKIPIPLQKIKIYEPELLGILSKYGKWTETSQYKEIKTTVGEKITEIGGKEGENKTPSDKIEKVAKEALMARGWSEHEAQQVLDRIKKAPNSEAKSKIIEKTIEKLSVIQTTKEFGLDLPEDVAEIFRPSAFLPKENVISVWKRGKRELYQVDPEIARAMQALDREQMNTIVKILSIPSRWLRAGATLSPEFIARNPIRDQFSAFVYSKYGFVPGIDLTRGIFHIFRNDDFYWKWKQAGGEHSMLVSMDRKYLQKGLDAILSGNGVFLPENLKGVIKNPIEALRLLSEFGEAGTRIGEFLKAVKKEGLTKEGLLRGGFASREVTLDFARLGAKTKALNAIIAFWNANVQGTDKMARAFKANPISTTMKVLAAITIPSILLVIVNRDDKRWQEIPQWQKDLFWIVMTKNHIWRIPKPFELGIIFGTIPERITEYVLEHDPKAFKGILNTIGNGAAPGFIPTTLVPLLENWANKSFFTDRPIVPRGKEELLPQYQYQNHTTETAKSIGKMISHLPLVGDTSVASPSKIENLIQGWSGGLGSLTLQSIDAALRKSGVMPDEIKPSKTLSDIPLIRAFHVRYPSADAESIKQFYDSYSKASQIISTAKNLQKQGKKDETIMLLRSGNLVRLNKIHTALGNAHRMIDLIYAMQDITPDEKRTMLDDIYMNMISIAEQGNKALKLINSEIGP